MMHAVKGNQITVKDTLFNSIIMNSSCVPQKKHRVWVEKISIQQHLYITRNNRDRTLNGAKIISGFKRQLGERPRKPYAKNALYLNFSRVLDREHNYFLYPSVLKRKPYIKELYRVLLIGKKPDFNDHLLPEHNTYSSLVSATPINQFREMPYSATAGLLGIL